MYDSVCYMKSRFFLKESQHQNNNISDQTMRNYAAADKTKYEINYTSRNLSEWALLMFCPISIVLSYRGSAFCFAEHGGIWTPADNDRMLNIFYSVLEILWNVEVIFCLFSILALPIHEKL